ncbi:(d)CMP kinase [Bacteriovoracales bacterium]|nr:(d)CMP kinase [Bacteriovoracales bacterium]
MTCEAVVAIDGPSGSGKSSMAKNLAEEMGLLYVDTGSMFRALALVAKKKGLPLTSEGITSDFLNSLEIEYGISENELIKVNGENLTNSIRDHQVSGLASQISQISNVRDFLRGFQRNLVKMKTCVMEGRDIGTVVFPKAFCKIYLTASDETRALRRLKQLQEKGETTLELSDVLRDVRKRDEDDSKRSLAPLKQAEDALFIDTTLMSTEDVLEKLKNIVLEKAKIRGVELKKVH